MREDGRMSPTSPVAVVPGAEPFSADGGRIGVLLSHGFTGSPASMTPWGKHLADQGYTVRVPRLPGHGTTWKDMNRTRWEDWYAELDTALTELQVALRQGRRGRPLDGWLPRPATRAAAPRRRRRAGAGQPCDQPRPVRRQARTGPAVGRPRMPGIGNDIKKPGGDEIGYDKTPLKALASQLKMWKDVRANLGKVTQP